MNQEEEYKAFLQWKEAGAPLTPAMQVEEVKHVVPDRKSVV